MPQPLADNVKPPSTPWRDTTYSVVAMSRPSHQTQPQTLWQGIKLPRLARELRRTVTFPQPWGSPFAGHGVRYDLTAEVWEYPRHSTHPVVVRARKMIPPASPAGSGSEGQSRSHHTWHPRKGRCQGEAHHPPAADRWARPSGTTSGKCQTACESTTCKYSRGSIGSPSPPPRKVDLQSNVLPAWGRSAGLATGV